MRIQLIFRIFKLFKQMFDKDAECKTALLKK